MEIEKLMRLIDELRQQANVMRETAIDLDWDGEPDDLDALMTEAADAIEELVEKMAENDSLHTALSLIWAEVVKSGNSEAIDYGWPKACAAVRDVLTKYPPNENA